MKKILLTIIGLALASPAWSAQTAVTQISGTQASVGALKTQVNTKLGTVESNRQDHETRVAAMETGKAGVDCFASEAAFNACFPLDWSAGGGGSTYTAGTGISITDGVISSTVTLADLWDLDYNDLINAPTGGSMTWPSTAGIPYWTSGTSWGGAYTLVTSVGATGADTSIPSEQAVREAINALPSLSAGTGITITEDGGGAGVDTINVTANTYQAYDANMIAWPSAISATEVEYLNGLTEALSTSLAGKQAADAQLDTWAGVTPGTGVATALAANTGAVGGLPVVIASGTYTVDTAEIAANTCASAVAVTASGVATTDVIIASPNAILSTVAGFGVTTAGAVRVDAYPTSGNVNFQFCNPTGAAIDPGSVTFNWKVIR